MPWAARKPAFWRAEGQKRLQNYLPVSSVQVWVRMGSAGFAVLSVLLYLSGVEGRGGTIPVAKKRTTIPPARVPSAYHHRGLFLYLTWTLRFLIALAPSCLPRL